jgi:hypothetical protein
MHVLGRPSFHVFLHCSALSDAQRGANRRASTAVISWRDARRASELGAKLRRTETNPLAIGQIGGKFGQCGDREGQLLFAKTCPVGKLGCDNSTWAVENLRVRSVLEKLQPKV